jgi:hypothetical protein
MLLLPESTTRFRSEKRFLEIKKRFEGRTYSIEKTYHGLVFYTTIKEFSIDNEGKLVVFCGNSSFDHVEEAKFVARLIQYFGYHTFYLRNGSSIFYFDNWKIAYVNPFVFEDVVYPSIRRVKAQVIDANLVGVQPMGLPTDMVFYSDYTISFTKNRYKPHLESKYAALQALIAWTKQLASQSMGIPAYLVGQPLALPKDYSTQRMEELIAWWYVKN